jgi:hypothetical protein
MKILHATKNIVDVFLGNGWEHWCRFNVHKGHIRMIGGTPVPKDVMLALRKRYQV